MSVDAQAATRSSRAGVAGQATPALRRASLAVLVLTVIEYGLGMYVNLFVAIPRADHGGSIGTVYSNGPAMLSLHATIGLLLGVASIAVLVLAIRTRRLSFIALAVLGLIALGSASATGASFTSTGDDVDSMGMAVTAGVALLCYAVIIYLQARVPSRQASPTPTHG